MIMYSLGNGFIYSHLIHESLKTLISFARRLFNGNQETMRWSVSRRKLNHCLTFGSFAEQVIRLAASGSVNFVSPVGLHTFDIILIYKGQQEVSRRTGALC